MIKNKYNKETPKIKFNFQFRKGSVNNDSCNRKANYIKSHTSTQSLQRNGE